MGRHKKWEMSRKILIIFTAIASLLMILSSICNWIAYYSEKLFPQYFIYGDLIMGKTSQEWHFYSDIFVGLHDYVCVLFVIVFGTLLLFNKLSVSRYIKGILTLYYVRVCVVYTFMELLDPAIITTGIKNMIYMKFRIHCWSIALVFLLIYFLRCLLLTIYHRWVARKENRE